MTFKKGQKIRLTASFGKLTPVGTEGIVRRDGLSPLGFVAISAKGELLLARPGEIEVINTGCDGLRG